MPDLMQVYVIEGRGKGVRPDYNSHIWRPMEACVGSTEAKTRRRAWEEDYPRREFRIRTYVPK